MKHIQCFVLFSAVVIVASVVALLLHFNGPNATATATTIEGFQTAVATRKMPRVQVSAASQPSFSSTAGSADGSSDHQYLLDNLLKKQDRLAEAFENRQIGSVTATTTKKNGIASTSASSKAITEPFDTMNAVKNADISVQVGCSKKCVKINKITDSIGGNCVNPPISKNDKRPDYSKKYCLAFRVPDGDSMLEQQCATCGYYAFTAECLKKADPKNPNRCTKYGNYAANAKPYNDCSNDDNCNLFLEKGGGGGGGGGSGDTPDKSGADCSKEYCPAKEVAIPNVSTATQKCIIPGCLSNSGGLPYPKDFYGNDMINPCKRNGNGYICPAVTFGSTESYNSAGGSDPCYITGGKPDILKFQSMDQVPVCNSVKLPSVQNYKPFVSDPYMSDAVGTTGTGAGSAGTSAATGTGGRTGSRSAGTGTGRISGSGRSSGLSTGTGNVVNVYHHYLSGRPRWSNTDKQPESGLVYLGIY